MAKEYVCPKCGSHNMALCTSTYAYFDVKDGRLGPVRLDPISESCMNECAADTLDDLEFKCLDCKYNFAAEHEDDGKTLKIGVEV